MEKIVLSTAAFCLWNITPEMKLNICRELKFEDIQVALSTEKMVYNLVACLESNLDVSGFKNISLHAPWCGVIYGDNKRTQRILSGLRRICELLPIKQVLFRVDNIQAVEVLMASGLPVGLENSDHDHDFLKIRSLMKRTSLPVALNLNRGARCGEGLERFTREFQHRISSVLISGFDPDFGRMPLVKTQQYGLLSIVRAMEVPLVIEGLFDPNDKASIEVERQMIHYHVSSDEVCTA